MSLMASHQKGIPKPCRNNHCVGICSITSVFKTASLNTKMQNLLLGKAEFDNQPKKLLTAVIHGHDKEHCGQMKPQMQFTSKVFRT